MSKTKMKPRMPETPIEFQAETKAHLMMDMERFSSGNMSMGIESATVSQGKGEDAKVLGEVRLNLGCGVTIHINGRTWGIDPMDLYNIGKQADDAYVESLKKS